MTHQGHLKPRSLEEAISMLSEYGGNAKIFAGGTDLLVKMKKKVLLPEYLINIQGIKELDSIVYDKTSGFRIGPMTPIFSLQNSSLIRDRFHALHQAAAVLGTPVIRRQATIGGNLCNAAPSADTAPPLIVLGAVLKISEMEGGKTVPIEGFFTGPGTTCLEPGQMLTSIQIPHPTPQTGSAYLKHTRTNGADLAIVGVAALVVMGDGFIEDIKIALGAVAPTPVRAKNAEEILKGKQPGIELLNEAGKAAAIESIPIDDTRSSSENRREIVSVMVRRAVKQAIDQINPEV